MSRHTIGHPRRGRRRDDPSGAAAVLDAAVREVRSGSALTVAGRTALSTRPDVLADLRIALERGDPLVSALAASPPGTPSETVVHRALLVATTAGGDVATVLEAGVEVLRERHAWALERRAQSAQARVSASVLTAVPVAFALLGLLTSDRVRQAYSAVAATVPLTAAGVAVNLLGWWWMRRLVTSAS